MSEQKIEQFWRDATAVDVARVVNGEKVEARFRELETDPWCSPRELRGARADADRKPRWFALTSSWRFCQVYSEPSWYKNKPDPGEGYRLLEKFPDEPKLGTDEVWRLFKTWETTANDNGVQEEDCWYRRRIEPVEPVEPETARLDEGSKCPIQGCSGVLRFRPVKDCSCHIRPPCSHCADNPPCCLVCEWTTGDPIEPVEPEPRHYVLRVGDSVETPSGDRMKCVEPGVEQRHYKLWVTDTISLPNGQTITITEKGFEVTQ